MLEGLQHFACVLFSLLSNLFFFSLFPIDLIAPRIISPAYILVIGLHSLSAMRNIFWKEWWSRLAAGVAGVVDTLLQMRNFVKLCYLGYILGFLPFPARGRCWFAESNAHISGVLRQPWCRAPSIANLRHVWARKFMTLALKWYSCRCS